MHQQVVEAVFEGGVFRPFTQPAVVDGTRVRLTIESATAMDPDEMLALAARVLEGLTVEEMAAFEAIALDRGSFFGHPAAS